MRGFKLTAAAAVVVAVALLGGRSSNALTLVPPIKEIDANKGDTVTTQIVLVNNEAETKTYFSSTASIRSMDEQGRPIYLPEAEKFGLATWIEIAPGPFTLKPGDRTEISVVIKVPTNADPGGHYGAVLFTPEAPTLTAGNQVAVTTKLASILLMRIGGAIQESGTIEQFVTTNGKTSFNRLPVDFTLRFMNSGNVHLRPTGKIEVRNMLGGTATVIPVNTEQHAILPQTTRVFDQRWLKADDDGSKGFFKEFAQEWQNFALGPYTADVNLSYGLNNDKTATATVRFWVMPWRIIVLTIVAIILIILLIMFLVKRYNKWIISKATPKTPSQTTPAPKK